MTAEQSNIFSQIVDTNWEVKQLTIAGDWDAARKKVIEHNAHVEKLKKLMGEAEYNQFINMGRKMFAPSDNN